MSPGARGSAFGLTALGLASLGVQYFKTAPFETDCPWVSEDAITIENLLRFHEYFDDKMISMKNFPLDFEKVRSTHCGFFAQMWKDLEEKRSCKYPPPS